MTAATDADTFLAGFFGEGNDLSPAALADNAPELAAWLDERLARLRRDPGVGSYPSPPYRRQDKVVWPRPFKPPTERTLPGPRGVHRSGVREGRPARDAQRAGSCRRCRDPVHRRACPDAGSPPRPAAASTPRTRAFRDAGCLAATPRTRPLTPTGATPPRVRDGRSCSRGGCLRGTAEGDRADRAVVCTERPLPPHPSPRRTAPVRCDPRACPSWRRFSPSAGQHACRQASWKPST